MSKKPVRVVYVYGCWMTPLENFCLAFLLDVRLVDGGSPYFTEYTKMVQPEFTQMVL